MRQAQLDLQEAGQLSHSSTYLVDANKPEAGWGSPEWLDNDSYFSREWPDIVRIMKTTEEAFEYVRSAVAPPARGIDCLHIGADHSFQAAYRDFRRYSRLCAPNAIITMHDTVYPRAGVCRAIAEIRKCGWYDVVDLTTQGAGLAIITQKPI